MEDQQITADSVIRLYENNLLDYEKKDGRNVFTYTSPKGFTMPFTADWFVNDPSSRYSLKQVREMMRNLVNAAEREEKIQSYLKDPAKIASLVDNMKKFGMVYDPEKQIYFYAVENKIIFFTEIDYIVALLVEHPDVSVQFILDGMRDDAESEKTK